MLRELSCLKLAVLIACIVMSTTACVSTKAVLLNPVGERYYPVSPEQVRIFTSIKELEEYDYIELAVITSEGNTTFTDQEDMINSIRKKAGSLGANAILMPGINEPGTGAKIAGAVLGVGVNRNSQTTAYRILGKKSDQ